MKSGFFSIKITDLRGLEEINAFFEERKYIVQKHLAPIVFLAGVRALAKESNLLEKMSKDLGSLKNDSAKNQPSVKTKAKRKIPKKINNSKIKQLNLVEESQKQSKEAQK